MRLNIKTAITAVTISAATFLAGIDAQAQTPATARESIAESRIKLPEYFGVYAVHKNGETSVLKPYRQTEIDDETQYVSLPEGAEFIVYGKNPDPSACNLIILGRDPDAQLTPQQQQSIRKRMGDADRRSIAMLMGPDAVDTTEAVEVLAKPVSNQPQMLRLIPACTLPTGVYLFIGEGDKSVFSVGKLPSRKEAKANVCINNLRQIDAQKELWALEAGATSGPVSEAVVNKRFEKGRPTCPDGGTYSYNALGVDPTCTVQGHVL